VSTKQTHLFVFHIPESQIITDIHVIIIIVIKNAIVPFPSPSAQQLTKKAQRVWRNYEINRKKVKAKTFRKEEGTILTND
jgi:hypothetical protein